MNTKHCFFIIILFAVAGCSTPRIMLKNAKTGQIVSCGGSATGSMVGGAIGYHIQKSNDIECKVAYIEAGFEVIKDVSE